MAAPDWNEYIKQKQMEIFYSEFPEARLAEEKAKYLNTYGAEGAKQLQAAGVDLPQTYVDPSREAEYKGYFSEHVAHGAYAPDQWDYFRDYFMGKPGGLAGADTPAQGGKWYGGEGGVEFQPNVPQGSYRDTGNWLTGFTGALPAVGISMAQSMLDPTGISRAYEDLRSSHGVADAVDKLIDAPTGGQVNTISSAIGSAIKDEPGIKTGVNVVGDVVAGILGAAYGPAAAAAVSGVKGKIIGTPPEDNMFNAARAAATSYALNKIGSTIGGALDVGGDPLGGGLTDPDMLNAAMGPDWLTGGGIESGYGFGTAAQIGAEPGILAQIADYVPGMGDIPDTISTGLDVASAITGPGGIQGEPLPPLPGLLSPDAPPEDLPPLPELGNYPMPERVSLAMPEGMTFPEIAPYLLKNWDRMSPEEQEQWLVTRGGEISKRRRGSWAGNLSGIRGGKGAGLEYAELVGTSGGKQILGE